MTVDLKDYTLPCCWRRSTF